MGHARKPADPESNRRLWFESRNSSDGGNKIKLKKKKRVVLTWDPKAFNL